MRPSTKQPEISGPGRAPIWRSAM
ncbi:unnamed protein product [Spirodela intermedia]|uniref:Uncharacterized protein n=1 Tax=Spirodela intermedia TaxID=51605 RepID=A0A7I8L265_SPIIN|nr:unnamed protein product [Spirodela intermedia]